MPPWTRSTIVQIFPVTRSVSAARAASEAIDELEASGTLDRARKAATLILEQWKRDEPNISSEIHAEGHEGG